MTTDSGMAISGDSTSTSTRGAAVRIARAACLTLIVAISLLTFPSAITWLIGFWLLWHCVMVLRGKPGPIPLLTCVAILLAKRIFWAPSIVVWSAAALTIAAVLVIQSARKAPWQRVSVMGIVVLWTAWAFVLFQWRTIAQCNHTVSFDPAGTVVCLGDSLTSGLLPDRGYPEELQKLIRMPITNLGQSGITTDDGYQRLSRIAHTHPQVVIVELGGHDFLKGRTRAETKASLQRVIEACGKLGAEVILMEIPRGFMTDPYAGMERELAYEDDVQLVSDTSIRQLVLWSPVAPPGMWLPQSHLSDDGIHTNARGNKYIARRVAKALARMYGNQVRIKPPQ